MPTISSNSPSWQSARSRYAALTRSRPADDPDLQSAKTSLARLKWLADIEALVAKAPPLSADQKSQISALLFLSGDA